jgi:hypothetical protein
VRVSGQLSFRSVTYSEIPLEIWDESPPARDSFVLIPPHEHVFLVKQVTGDTVTVASGSGEAAEFPLRPLTFVEICAPSQYLCKLFTVPAVSGSYGALADGPELTTDAASIWSFFGSNAVNERELERLKSGCRLTSVFEEDVPPLEQILTEQVAPGLREVIREGVSDGRFPSHRLLLRLFDFPALSFFDSDFGPLPPPQVAHALRGRSPFCGKCLPIPDVCVWHYEQLHRVKATSIIRLWERDNFAPISRAKAAHFVVFCDAAFTRTLVRAFMRTLVHFYSLFNFGALTEYAKSDPYSFHRPVDVRIAVQAFLAAHPCIELSSTPLVVFTIDDGHIGQDFHPPINHMPVPPALVRSMDSTAIKALAFRLYAQLRTYFSLQCDKPQVEQLFFGYRYQPPFALGRTDDTAITIHIAWNCHAGIAIATDDVGTALAELKMPGFEDVRRFVTELRSALAPLRTTFTVGIAGELLYESELDAFSHFPDGVFVFSIFPCASVQVAVDPECSEDIYVRIGTEQAYGDAGESAEPIVSAVVLAKGHCPYTMSLYIEPRTRGNSDSLGWLAGEFSKLSWLSVMPGRERRVTALPPHFAALLRRTRFSSLPLSRFEFL